MSGVLVVENNHQIRSMYIAGLIGFGYDIIEAPTIRDARKHLASGFDPSVVLLDLDLSDGTGQDLIRYIRHDMGRTDVRIIVATGMQVNDDDIIGAGADMVLKKPVDLIELLDRIYVYSS